MQKADGSELGCDRKTYFCNYSSYVLLLMEFEWDEA